MNLCKVYQNCSDLLIDKLRTMTKRSGYRIDETSVKFLYFRSVSGNRLTTFIIKGANGQLSWVLDSQRAGLEIVGELGWRLEEKRKRRQRLEQSVRYHVLLI